MKYLYEALTEYQHSDAYPFHMPGHKRQGMEFTNPFLIDITEIDGFDDLHHSEGLIKEAQQRASELYKAEETYFLINGSTGGILSAISAAVGFRGRILIARNCHKAAYHGACLRQLSVTYLYPETDPVTGLNGGILPQQVSDELARDSQIEAVFLTSPTYDGVVSDLAGIVAAAHRHGVPVIVDAAHGAHFGFDPAFPESAVRSGADIVIHSLHKTLPALTQTALLHVSGKLVDRDALRRYLGIYQTSSPSYVLMASIDECIRKIAAEGPQLFAAFGQRLRCFYREAEQLKRLQVIGPSLKGQRGIFDLDPAKVIIASGAAGMDGLQLQQRLRQDWGLELEMAAGGYALALTSVMDTEDGLRRLSAALQQIDQETDTSPTVQTMASGVIKCQQNCAIYQAVEAPWEQSALSGSGGRTAAEFLYLYPPGIPLMVPGERITEELIGVVEAYKKSGYTLQGPADHQVGLIRVLKD